MKQIKKIDEKTGEIIEVSWKNFADLREQYELLQISEKVIANQKAALQEAILEELGPDKVYPFNDGKRFVFKSPIRRAYDPSVLRRHIDADRLADIMKFDTGAVDKLLVEMVKNNELEPEAAREIQASVTQKPTKPYVVLEKL